MLHYRTPHNKKDFDSVIELVEQAYSLENYITTNTEHKPISSFLNRQGSATVMALEGEKLRGTISIVKDSERGLPMDCSFKEELDVLRKQGFQLAEVCQFSTDHKLIATDSDSQKTAQQSDTSAISLGLLAHTLQLALRNKLTYLCFSVNEKHDHFYQLIGCTPISELRSYSLANDALSRAFFLDLNAPITGNSSTVFLQKILKLPMDESLINSDVFNQSTYT